MYSYMGTHSDPSEEALTRDRTIGTGGVSGAAGVGLGGYGATASPVHVTTATAAGGTHPATSPTSNAEGTPLVTYRVKSGSRGAEHGTLLIRFYLLPNLAGVVVGSTRFKLN